MAEHPHTGGQWATAFGVGTVGEDGGGWPPRCKWSVFSCCLFCSRIVGIVLFLSVFFLFFRPTLRGWRLLRTGGADPNRRVQRFKRPPRACLIGLRSQRGGRVGPAGSNFDPTALTPLPSANMSAPPRPGGGGGGGASIRGAPPKCSPSLPPASSNADLAVLK